MQMEFKNGSRITEITQVVLTNIEILGKETGHSFITNVGVLQTLMIHQVMLMVMPWLVEQVLKDAL